MIGETARQHHTPKSSHRRLTAPVTHGHTLDVGLKHNPMTIELSDSPHLTVNKLNLQQRINSICFDADSRDQSLSNSMALVNKDDVSFRESHLKKLEPKINQNLDIFQYTERGNMSRRRRSKRFKLLAKIRQPGMTNVTFDLDEYDGYQCTPEEVFDELAVLIKRKDKDNQHFYSKKVFNADVKSRGTLLGLDQILGYLNEKKNSKDNSPASQQSKLEEELNRWKKDFTAIADQRLLESITNLEKPTQTPARQVQDNPQKAFYIESLASLPDQKGSLYVMIEDDDNDDDKDGPLETPLKPPLSIKQPQTLTTKVPVSLAMLPYPQSSDMGNASVSDGQTPDSNIADIDDIDDDGSLPLRSEYVHYRRLMPIHAVLEKNPFARAGGKSDM